MLVAEKWIGRELYINIEVHDDEYEETGQTSIIPNPLNLDNGDSVNLSFGTTKDGVKCKPGSRTTS